MLCVDDLMMMMMLLNCQSYITEKNEVSEQGT